MNIMDYSTDNFYDELFENNKIPHADVMPLISHINNLQPSVLARKQKSAELALLQLGITFNVNGGKHGQEKIFPFDILPRIIQAKEWEKLSYGLEQRTVALNMFVDDIYHDQRILKDKIIPAEMVLSSTSFRKECMGITPPQNIWAHINGTDLVRDDEGDFYVLEDNSRCPSGVSYVLENRVILKQTFPWAFKTMNVRPVADYPERLLELLQSLCPDVDEPNIAILTPGIYNSAYFEHSYLAQQLGVQLVEGRDLIVESDEVFMKTTKGLEKVDVIYRRIDDEYLDPLEFNPKSLLGVKGIMNAYRKGNVVLVNAPGAGIADDKAIYSFVPDIIKYYLGEEAIIPNVKTYICYDAKDKKYVLENLDKLVIKEVNMSGGYGIFIGRWASAQDKINIRKAIEANPRDYIAQPILNLSRSPTIVGKHIEGRHVDFRPFILSGKKTYVLPGGLTRVALVKNSLVVNSSQGGGSKDTWVLK
tara:strand:+ start:10664 stop:12091 length:1428 start_codon:yes stop_codon:yes gene_type:complete